MHDWFAVTNRLPSHRLSSQFGALSNMSSRALPTAVFPPISFCVPLMTYFLINVLLVRVFAKNLVQVLTEVHADLVAHDEVVDNCVLGAAEYGNAKAVV